MPRYIAAHQSTPLVLAGRRWVALPAKSCRIRFRLLFACVVALLRPAQQGRIRVLESLHRAEVLQEAAL